MESLMDQLEWTMNMQEERKWRRDGGRITSWMT